MNLYMETATDGADATERDEGHSTCECGAVIDIPLLVCQECAWVSRTDWDPE